MSGSVASLSFNIDSSEAQRAIAVLEAMKATSINVTQATRDLNTQTTSLTQAYGQERDAIVRLADETKRYDGTLSGLVTTMNNLRTGITSTTAQFAAYTEIMKTATATSAQFNATVTGLEQYVLKAQQLRVQTQDLATGLSNITAALQQQTQQGFATRSMLEQLGVSMRGIGADRPDIVLQRLSEALGRTQLNAYTIQGVQQILGPISPTAIQALGQSPYIGYRDQQLQQRIAGQQSQISEQAAANQRRDIDTARREAERQDLMSRYTIDPTIAGRLGISFDWARDVFGGQTSAQNLARLRQISAMPAEQRAAYTGYGAQIGDFFRTGWAGRQGNRFRMLGSNLDSIGSQFGEDLFNEGPGTAVGNAVGRGIQAFTGYGGEYGVPRSIEVMTPAERLMRRGEAAQLFAGVGDPRMQNYEGIQRQLEMLNQTSRQGDQPTMQENYRTYFGPDEGPRAFGQRRSDLELQRGFAMNPGSLFTANSAQQRWLASLPYYQRSAARNALQTLPPGFNVTGMSLNDVTSMGRFPQGQRANAGDVGLAPFAEDQRMQGRERTESTDRQIEFLSKLTAEMQKGKGASEDFYRSYSQFQQVLGESGNLFLANAAGLDALNLSFAQRLIRGQQMVQQIRDETAAIRDQTALTSPTGSMDRTSRQALAITGGAEAERRNLVRTGALPDPMRGGEYQPRDQNGNPVGNPITVGRAEALRVNQEFLSSRSARTSAEGEAGLQNQQLGQRSQVEDVQRINQLMREQGMSASQAAEQTERENRLRTSINQQYHDQLDVARQVFDAEVRKSNELQKQVALTEQLDRNMQTFRDQATQTAQTLVQLGVAPWQRDAASRVTGFAIQNAQAGGGAGGPVFSAVAGIESGNRNIPNTKDPPTSSGQAQGHFQITTGTWNEFKGRVPGASQYATPLDAPFDVQQAVAGFIPGSRWAKSTQDALTARFGPLNMNLPLGQLNAQVAGRGDGSGTAAAAQSRDVASRIQAEVEAAFRENREFHLPELGEARNRDINTEIENERRQMTAGQTLEVRRAGEQSASRRVATRAQAQLSQAERQRIVPLRTDVEPGAARELQGQQVGEIRDTQARDATIARNDFTRQTDQIRQQANALNESGARYKEVTAEIAAFNAQQVHGAENVDLHTQKLIEQDRQLAQTESQLAQSNDALAKNNELQQALTDRGAFSDPLDQARTQRNVALQQTFRDSPGSENTPAGQRAIQLNQAKDVTDANAKSMRDLRDAASSAENAIVSTLDNIIVKGQVSRQTLLGLTQQLASIALNAAIFKPLETMIGNVFSGNDAMSGVGGIFGFLGKLGGGGAAAATASGGLAAAQGSELLSAGLYARGGVFVGGIDQLANQVVTRPTMFKTYAQGGLMGEAGPEAIVPLVRGQDGNLGVRGGGGGPSVQVNTPIHINTAGGGGGAPMDPAAMKVLQQKLDTTVRMAVQGVMTEQRRPGGQLFYG